MGFFDSEEKMAPAELVKRLKLQIKEAEVDNSLTIKRMEAQHQIELNEKNFEIKHLKDEELLKKDAEIVELKQTVAVQQQKIEMLDKITDLNSDVIDVKKLVEKLIDKLPEVKISSLSVTGGTTSN